MCLATDFSSQVYLMSYFNSLYFNIGLAFDNRHILLLKNNHEEILSFFFTAL